MTTTLNASSAGHNGEGALGGDLSSCATPASPACGMHKGGHAHCRAELRMHLSSVAASLLTRALYSCQIEQRSDEENIEHHQQQALPRLVVYLPSFTKLVCRNAFVRPGSGFFRGGVLSELAHVVVSVRPFPPAVAGAKATEKTAPACLQRGVAGWPLRHEAGA